MDLECHDILAFAKEELGNKLGNFELRAGFCCVRLARHNRIGCRQSELPLNRKANCARPKADNTGDPKDQKPRGRRTKA